MPDFDVVVIGAGSAGSVAASVLSTQTNVSVCLIEAGPDYGPFEAGRWPSEILDPRLRPRTHDWGFVDSRAKVVGGCSAHNQCAAVWGLPEDYDLWGGAGNLGWSYKEISKLIQEIERCSVDSLTEWRGKDGWLPTRHYRDEELASWQLAFLESTVSMGYSRIADLSAPQPGEGVMPFHANVYKSTRWNAAFAFLDRARGRRNLTVLPNTLAEKLLFEHKNARTLVCQSGSDTLEIRARQFVICAGAYSSPGILMRSGIGPRTELERLGIRIHRDLLGVGKNLQDHSVVSVEFELSEHGLRALEQDVVEGSFHESQVILRARSVHCKGPFDLHLAPYQTTADSGEYVSAVLACDMVPQSRGSIHLSGTDAELPPLIDFGFLTDPLHQDASVLIDGLRLIHRLAESGPLATMIESRTPRPDAMKPGESYSYVESHVDGYAHPVGTCRMGQLSDSLAVVDSGGLVRGTSNVYVADASIIPTIPRANTNLTCMLIGLKIAKELSIRLLRS